MIASAAAAAAGKAFAGAEHEWREPQNETGSGYAWGFLQGKVLVESV